MREAAFSRARDYFGSDHRVRACWLWGPMAHYILGPLQELSMGIIVRSEDFDQYVAEVDTHIRAIMPPVAIWHYGWGADVRRLRHVQAVFEGGLYFELAVHQSDGFGPQPGPIEPIFNRDVELKTAPPVPQPGRFEQAATRFWMGALLAVNQIVRNDPWEALDFIQTRRNLFIECWKLGQPATSPERLSVYDEPALTEALQERLADTIPASAADDDLARALRAVTELFNEVIPPLARDLAAAYPTELANTVREVLANELGKLLLDAEL